MTTNFTQPTCGICEDSHTATKFCLDCNESICEDVAITHQRYRKFSKHIVVPIEEYNRYQKANPHLGYLHHKSCIQHNRPFEFLDLDTKIHNTLLCSKCLTGKNTPIELGECASSFLLEKLDHIRELGSQGTAHLAELREEEDHFTSRLKGLEESRARSLIEIRRVFGSLHEALQTRQSELEREVEELVKSAGFALSEERERSRVWQGQWSMLGQCVEEINSTAHSLPNPQSLDTSQESTTSSSSSSSSASSSPEPLTSSFHGLNDKALMVDACLLEDALRSSLSSSRASSSLTDVQSRVRVSEIRDQIEFSTNTQSLKEEGNLETLFHRIFSIFSVISTSSFPDWSKNKVQSVMTFYSQGNGANQLSSPCEITYSPDSKLFYVCDFNNRRIQVFRNHPQAELEGRVEIEFLPPLGSAGPSSSSSSSSLALTPPYTAPPSSLGPTSICYHDGQLFIADYNNHRVQVWREEDGSFLRMIGTGYGNAVGQFINPCGCTVHQNHLFVSDHHNHRIQKFSLSDWSAVKVIGSQGSGLGQLTNPRELSVFNGKLYVADYNNHRISVFDPESGAVLSVIGPSLPTDGNLSSPWGLLFSHNLLFVSSQHRISVFDSEHNYLYSFGSYGSGEGQFSTPWGMVMVNDNLFVCDRYNGRIHVFKQILE